MPDNELELILAHAVADSRCDMGNVQLLNPQSGQLQIVASLGFGWRFLNYFDSVHGGQAACGTALQTGGRIVVEDVATSPVYDEVLRAFMLEASALACQSTPLCDASGRVIGMLSTHRREAGPFDEQLWPRIDALAAQAARAIEQAGKTPGNLLGSAARSRMLIESARKLIDLSSTRLNRKSS